MSTLSSVLPSIATTSARRLDRLLPTVCGPGPQITGSALSSSAWIDEEPSRLIERQKGIGFMEKCSSSDISKSFVALASVTATGRAYTRTEPSGTL